MARKLQYIPNMYLPTNILRGGRDVFSTEPEIWETISESSKVVWNLISESLKDSETNLWRMKGFAEGICYPEQVEKLREIGLQRHLSQTTTPSPFTKPLSSYDDFLIELMKVGVKIIPTEKDDLLRNHQAIVERVAWIYNTIEESDDPEASLNKFNNEIHELMKREKIACKERDRFIARRINETLKDGESGILVIGAAHKVQDFLDPDIEFEVNEELVKEITERMECIQTLINEVSDVWGRARREQLNQINSTEKKG